MNDGLLGYPKGLLVFGIPQWNSLRLVGSHLVGEWTPATGVISGYEICKKADAAVDDSLAKRVAVVSSPRFEIPFNQGNGQRVVNGGFEGSNLSGWWINDNPGMNVWTIDSVIKYSGLHAAKAVTDNPAAPGSILGQRFSVVPGGVYRLSANVNVPTYTAPSGTVLFLEYIWTDSNGTFVSGLDHIWASFNAATSGWNHVSANVAAPANAANMDIWANAAFGSGDSGGAIMYLDDYGVIGPYPTSLPTDIFAIRAIDQNGNLTRFSDWLQPIQQSAQLGVSGALTVHFETPGNTPTQGLQITNMGLADTGWQYRHDTMPSYVSASSIKFAGIDLTGLFTGGVKVRFKQGGNFKYFSVASSSIASGDTTVILASSPNGDTVANAAITDMYYSYAANPQGWTWIASGSNPICCRFTGSVYVNNEAWGTMSSSSEDFDTDNMHSTSTNPTRLTFNTAGYYNFGYYGFTDLYNSGGRRYRIRLDGGSTYVLNSMRQLEWNGNTPQNGSDLRYFDAGDYIELQINQDNSDGIALTCYGSLWAHKI
jgi:hypothetical protein